MGCLVPTFRRSGDAFSVNFETGIRGRSDRGVEVRADRRHERCRRSRSTMATERASSSLSVWRSARVLSNQER